MSAVITGTIIQLEIGLPAMIQMENGRILRTSEVKHIVQHSDGRSEILTKNSHYVFVPAV